MSCKSQRRRITTGCFASKAETFCGISVVPRSQGFVDGESNPYPKSLRREFSLVVLLLDSYDTDDLIKL
jgi:hypothetical protein